MMATGALRIILFEKCWILAKKDQSPKKEETRDQGCFLGVNPYNFSYSYEEKEYIEKPFKREQLAGVKL